MDRDNIYTQKSEVKSQERVVVPVIEEQIHIDKEVVDKGSVRITKRIKEEEVDVETPYVSEEVQVNHVSINKYVDSNALPQVRNEGDTMIIPVLKEVVVVEKKVLLVEELHVTKQKVQRHSTVKHTIRKEEVIVDRFSDKDDIRKDI